MSYDTSAIRQFILKTFDDEEFRSLCFDYFRDVYIDLTTGMSFRQMVQLLLAYCERHSQLEALMAALQRERTALYQEQFAPVRPASPPTTHQRNPRQIFISHATADAEIAHRLAADLEAEGWALWIAPDSIQPGEKWVEAINRGLEASGVFVLLLTPEAVASRWVTSETNVAIEMEHEGLLQFIPLQIRPCPVPALWRAYQRIPFGGDYEVGWQVFLARLDPAAVPVSPSLPRIQVKPRQPEPEPPPRNNFIHEKSGLEFVRIPAGGFLYGEEKKKIYLPEYWISKMPVTNVHYARFVVETGYRMPHHWRKKLIYPDGLADHPVVYVDWYDATAFCKWAGGRLPIEEEWEKAARGTNGRIYPWGNEYKWNQNRCNSKDAHIKGTSRVAQFSPQGDSPYGCVDMIGNVWEWTNSWFVKKDQRIVCGGSWYDFCSAVTLHRISPPDLRDDDYGFRIVHHPPLQDH